MKYKYNEKKVNCFCYNLWAKLYQVPPRRYRPPKRQPPPLKFHKTSAPGKCTTSKLSSPPDFRWGVHNLPLDLLREGKYDMLI